MKLFAKQGSGRGVDKCERADSLPICRRGMGRAARQKEADPMTAQIINFAARRNQLRAKAITAANKAANTARIEREKLELAEKLGNTIGARLAAEVAIDHQEALRQREQAARPMPAYCDPANESRGAKYDATRDLDIKEIARRMRADIAALGLAKGIKVSVRIQRYSGGQSIDISVTALPAGFKVLSKKAASWKKQFPNRLHDMPCAGRAAQSDELRDLLGKLNAIHSAYNRDNSDRMTDYFDVRYYGDAGLDWQVRRDLEAAQLADEPGDYWAE
ncbi:MAG: hypothetical protein ACK4IS_13295 [Erythrobacter sp.]